MGRVYDVGRTAFTPGSAKTVLIVMAAAEKPFRVRRIEMASDDTAGATVIDWQLLRVTVDGTGGATTPVPTPHKQGDAAFSGTVRFGATGEPTAGTIFKPGKWNIQVPLTEVYGPDEEYSVPGATTEGIAIEFLDDPGDEVTVVMEIEEDF
jgi:hypothetical protein